MRSEIYDVGMSMIRRFPDDNPVAQVSLLFNRLATTGAAISLDETRIPEEHLIRSRG